MFWIFYFLIVIALLSLDCPKNNDSGQPTGANTIHINNRRYEAGRPSRDQFSPAWRDRSEPTNGWKDQDPQRRDEGRHDFRRGGNDLWSRDRYDDGRKGANYPRYLRDDDGYKPRRRSR